MMDCCRNNAEPPPCRISLHPVFAKGTFYGHPELLARFTRHAARHMIRRYERAWQILQDYEGAIRWPLLSGPDSMPPPTRRRHGFFGHHGRNRKLCLQ